MKALINMVAALAPAALGAPAQPQPFKFACVGTGKAEGNDGVHEIDPTKYRIEGQGQQVAILYQGYREENICPTGATCTVEVTDAVVKVEARDFPHHDPGYYAQFQIDRRSLIFKASGGGLDGGWSIAGKCRPERS